MSKAKFALLYIRNGRETIFPVEDIDQAVHIADAIADSDLLKVLDAWETDDGLTFDEYWEDYRHNKK